MDHGASQTTKQFSSLVRHRVAIIGAGWAGLACAHQLSATPGVHVQLFEAAPQLGGRARSFAWTPQKGGEALTIDNGQHMLVGAYSATLSLLGALGSGPNRLDRFPVTLVSSDGLQLRGARLPAPWHLLIAALRSTGLELRDFTSLLSLQRVLQRCHFRPDERQTVSELLAQAAATERVRDRLMRPLCLATLNTPMHVASAAIFSAVLRDTLFAQAKASDFLVANAGLSEIFALPMEQLLHSRGVEIHKNTRISYLTNRTKVSELELNFHSSRAPCQYDSVVIATPLAQVPDLLSPNDRESPASNRSHRDGVCLLGARSKRASRVCRSKCSRSEALTPTNYAR
jgi:hydroxysqualene dehydroxylase